MTRDQLIALLIAGAFCTGMSFMALVLTADTLSAARVVMTITLMLSAALVTALAAIALYRSP